jgi:PUA domain protein
LKINLVSKSETVQILKSVSDDWKLELPKIKNLKVYYIDSNAQIIIGDGIKILNVDGCYIPLLSEDTILEKLANVIVDMGAVKFMCNGANVMRPGIKKYTEFKKGDIVCIREESQNKFLAVGKAIMGSSELESISKGEIIKNIHYVSDKYWKIYKTI